MVLPQIMTLVDISRFKTVEEAIASAKTRRVPANLTKIKRINDDDVEVTPDGSVFYTMKYVAGKTLGNRTNPAAKEK